VDDTLAVRGGQALSDGGTDLHRLLPSHAAGRYPGSQRLAFEQLRDRVGDAFLGAEIPDLEDVGVGELGDRLGLGLESRETVASLGHILRQHLDRHVAIEPLVVRAVHHSHAAGADLLADTVVGERATDEVTHCLGSCCADVIAFLSELRGCLPSNERTTEPQIRRG